jgi:hypothetical protein
MRFVDHNRLAFWEGNSFSERILHFHELPFSLSLADSTLPEKAQPKQTGLIPKPSLAKPLTRPGPSKPSQPVPIRPNQTAIVSEDFFQGQCLLLI